MILLILSDLHGNLSALRSVLSGTKKFNIDACLLLGDIIDYGMHSNEVIEAVKTLPYPALCNIWGNHEKAIVSEDYSRFSSERGRECAKYTHSLLNDDSWDYIKNTMTNDGKYEFEIDGKKCLAVHGSLEDIYWKSIKPGINLSAYSKYDYVFSGHSHLPHFFEVFYEVDRPEYRNKKKTIFINPGSVGQPRNHNPMAQFVLLDTDTEEVKTIKVNYNIAKEQSAYNGAVDDFYRKRLEGGV